MPNSSQSSVMPKSCSLGSAALWSSTSRAAARPFFSFLLSSTADMSSDHPLQLHRHAHVAADLELAHHEAVHRVQLALEQGDEVVLADGDRAVGLAVLVADRIGLGLAVDHRHAVGAAVELEDGVESAAVADLGAQGFGDCLHVHLSCSG